MRGTRSERTMRWSLFVGSWSKRASSTVDSGIDLAPTATLRAGHQHEHADGHEQPDAEGDLVRRRSPSAPARAPSASGSRGRAPSRLHPDVVRRGQRLAHAGQALGEGHERANWSRVTIQAGQRRPRVDPTGRRRSDVVRDHGCTFGARYIAGRAPTRRPRRPPAATRSARLGRRARRRLRGSSPPASRSFPDRAARRRARAGRALGRSGRRRGRRSGRRQDRLGDEPRWYPIFGVVGLRRVVAEVGGHGSPSDALRGRR